MSDKKEFARMGNEIYENKIRPLVEEGNKGKMVAIDIESGAYEMGGSGDEIDCIHRLLDKNQDAKIWLVRIGYEEVYRRSWRLLNGTKTVSRS